MSPGPRGAPDTVGSSWPHPTFPSAVCLRCGPPASDAQLTEVLGLPCPPSWPGSCFCSHSCVFWLCCLQGMVPLAGFSSLAWTLPLQASTVDRGQPQPLPGVSAFCQAPKARGMVECCSRTVGPSRGGFLRPPGRVPNQSRDSPLVQLSRPSENQSRSRGGSW